MRIRLQVHRFFCDQTGCAARTFAEQIDGLTIRYARRSGLAHRMLAGVGLALGGRAGARLAAVLGLSVGRNVLIRLVRALPDPEIGVIAVLGVDLSRWRCYADRALWPRWAAWLGRASRQCQRVSGRDNRRRCRWCPG
jgi:hypothetical protein